jgi:hypothetical protein
VQRLSIYSLSKRHETDQTPSVHHRDPTLTLTEYTKRSSGAAACVCVCDTEQLRGAMSRGAACRPFTGAGGTGDKPATAFHAPARRLSHRRRRRTVARGPPSRRRRVIRGRAREATGGGGRGSVGKIHKILADEILAVLFTRFWSPDSDIASVLRTDAAVQNLSSVSTRGSASLHQKVLLCFLIFLDLLKEGKLILPYVSRFLLLRFQKHQIVITWCFHLHMFK